MFFEGVYKKRIKDSQMIHLLRNVSLCEKGLSLVEKGLAPFLCFEKGLAPFLCFEKGLVSFVTVIR